MRKLITGALAVLAAACSAAATNSAEEAQAAASNAELQLPLTTKAFVAELRARGITSKADALAMLPHAMKQRFVLVKNTGALGVASLDRPRVVHFEETGRFVVASSGHKIDEDLTANSLEILEQDDATQTYHLHTVTIDSSGVTFKEDDTACKGCHGSPGRPIWGSYPSWPAAYGSDDDNMTPEELAAFATFTAMATTDPDYRHLEIHPSSQGYYFPTPYGYPNAVFGSSVGTRWGYQLAARMQKSPSYTALGRYVVAAALGCDLRAVEPTINRMYSATSFAAEAKYPAKYAATKVYRLLGVEPTTDLRMENPVPDPPTVDYEVGYAPYDVGSDYLTNAIAFPLFVDALGKDAALASAYSAKQYAIDGLVKYSVKADVLGIESLGSSTDPPYYEAVLPPFTNYIYRPIGASVCTRLLQQ
jgi:hypothetical protein